MPLRAVGYDPGTRASKVALLEKEGASWVLKEGLINPPKVPKGSLAVALGAQAFTLREIRHPLKDPAKVAQTIRYEAEPYLSAPLDQSLLQYRILGESDGGSRVLLMALPKTRMAERLEAWRKDRLDPQTVTLDAAALWSCFAAFGPKDDKPVTLLDLGAQKTVLIVFQGGDLRLLRVLRVGLGPPPEGADPVEALNASADILVQEARRSWATVGVDEKLSQVLLTGGGALHPAFPNLLESRFRCPVGRFRFLDRLKHALEKDQAEAFEAQGAPAVGAALAAAGQDPAGLDFRIEEFRYRGRLPRLAGPAAAAMLAASALLCALAFDAHRQHGLWERQMNALSERQAEGWALAFGKTTPTEVRRLLMGDASAADVPVDQAIAEAREYLAQRSRVKTGATDLASVLDLLREFFQRVPAGAELTVLDLQAGQAGVNLKGRMPDEASIWALPEALSRAPSPFEVAPTNTVPSKDGGFEFPLSARRRQP